MKATVWHGKRDVRVEEVPDPMIQEPTDAIVRITSTGLCGSDLHLYEVLGAVHDRGRHPRPRADGRSSRRSAPASPTSRSGDRVVIPFQIACGSCFMCDRGLQTQCETTQVREHGMGAALFGYTKLYGAVPGGQAEYLRVPARRLRSRSRSPKGPPTTASSTSPTCCPPPGRPSSTPASPRATRCVVLGARARSATWPAGSPCTGASRDHRRRPGARAPRRGRRRAAPRRSTCDDVDDDARRPRPRADRRARARTRSSTPSAWRRTARPARRRCTSWSACCPTRVAEPLMNTAGIDRLAALHSAIDIVRRGGTISLSGVYGGTADPLPMLTLFDKQVQLRMGQANVKRWVPDILPLLADERPAGCRLLRDPPPAPGRGACGLRDVPEEEGRRGQGGLQPLRRSRT